MSHLRESIFSSTFRVFFAAFAAILGVIVAIVAAIFGFAAINDGIETPDKSTLTIAPDAEGNRELLSSTAPVILRIDINGVIGDPALTSKKVRTALLDSRVGVLKHNRVKGILLYLDTPGGLADDSSAIYHALMDYKKKYNVPIYAFIEGLCASGGMYIAAAADEVFSTPDSTIGSIGVRLGPAFNVFEAMQKIGVSSLTLTEGKNKDMLNPFRAWVPGEDQSLKDILASLYEQFVDVVVEGRKRLSRERLIQDYGAQVFIAEKAEQIGYIDNANSSYEETLAQLVQAAGITEKYQVLQIEPSRSVLAELFHEKCALLKGKIHHVFPLGPYMNTEMCGKLLYLYQP